MIHHDYESLSSGFAQEYQTAKGHEAMKHPGEQVVIGQGITQTEVHHAEVKVPPIAQQRA